MQVPRTTTIAVDDVWHHPIRLALPDRRSHLTIIGKTGVGKSTLLLRLMQADIAAGRGVSFIDPHGQAADELLDLIPAHRIQDVAYFDPGDLEWPVAFNLLAETPPDKRHLVTSSVVGACKAIWGESWGPRLEYLLGNCVATLLELRGATLLGIPRLLTDRAYRERALQRVFEPRLRAFWEHEFAAYSDRLQAEASAPVLNKIGQFLMSPAIRNIIGRTKSSIDLRFLMDRERILIANLAKGRVGADKSALLGALLITSFHLAALSRVDAREDDRRDHYLYVDEFQNFATESFADILSEARKFRLNLTLAHQYLDQLPEGLRSAVFGNVGSLVSFKVGARDAEFIAREMDHDVVPTQLSELSRFEVYTALAQDGVTSQARRGRTLPIVPEHHGRKDTIIEQSRMRFAKRRDKVEPLVLRQLG